MATVTLTRAKALKIFEAIGYKQAGKWDDKRLLAKLRKLQDEVDLDEVTKPKLKAALKKIIDADKILLGDDGKTNSDDKSTSSKKKTSKKKKATKKKIAEEDDEPKKSKKKTSKKQKTAKKKKTSKKKKATKKKTSGAGKDELGCRVGSQAGKINACLSKKGKSLEAIAKESGLSETRCRNHLKWMVETKGLVQQDAKGNYRL